MKLKFIVFLVIFVGLCCFPFGASIGKETQKWTYGPWEIQDMIALGNDFLVVDFGQNGLWSYDGSWIRMSHLDPQRMLEWGESTLVVDFGEHGLWKFDHSQWAKIAL